MESGTLAAFDPFTRSWQSGFFYQALGMCCVWFLLDVDQDVAHASQLRTCFRPHAHAVSNIQSGSTNIKTV